MPHVANRLDALPVTLPAGVATDLLVDDRGFDCAHGKVLVVTISNPGANPVDAIARLMTTVDAVETDATGYGPVNALGSLTLRFTDVVGRGARLRGTSAGGTSVVVSAVLADE